MLPDGYRWCSKVPQSAPVVKATIIKLPSQARAKIQNAQQKRGRVGVSGRPSYWRLPLPTSNLCGAPRSVSAEIAPRMIMQPGQCNPSAQALFQFAFLSLPVGSQIEATHGQPQRKTCKQVPFQTPPCHHHSSKITGYSRSWRLGTLHFSREQRERRIDRAANAARSWVVKA
jgi:hypothetical protein